jgi:tetratricopeptide (TPR) repeat protein
MRASTLPPEPPVVVGREDVLLAAKESLLAAATPERAIVLAGPAGIGKTTVALALVRRMAHWFPDGQVWIDASGLTPERSAQELIAAQLVQALDPHEHRRSGSVDAARELLSHRRALVAVDGLEDVGQVLELLPRRAWPSAMILTSRGAQWLHLATFQLAPLSTRDATLMLRAQAGDSPLMQDARLIDELVATCDGLPLALRFLGAFVAHNPDADARIVRRMRNDVFHSSWADVKAFPPQVRGVLLASYERLSAASAELLRAIALLPDESLTIAELQHVVAFDDTALSGLLESAFLQSDGTRFFMHSIVRRFAREQLTVEEADSFSARLATSLHLNSTDLSDTLRRQHSTPLRRLNQPSDRIEAQEFILRSAIEFGNDHDAARALLNLGALHLSAGHVEDAEAALHAALPIADRIGEQAVIAQATVTLGHIERDRGSFTRACQYYESSRQLFAAMEDRPGQALALVSLGEVLLDQDEFELARRNFEDALAITRPDELDVRAHILSGEARLAELGGDYDRARTLYESVLRSAPDVDERGQICDRLAMVELRDGHLDVASELLDTAVALYMRAGLLQAATRALLALGTLDIERGSLASARRRFSHAADLAAADEHRLSALAAYGVGLVALQTGIFDEALASLELAVALFREARDPLGEAHALNALATSLRDLYGDGSEMAAAQAARALFDRLGATPGEPHSTLRVLTLEDR